MRPSGFTEEQIIGMLRDRMLVRRQLAFAASRVSVVRDFGTTGGVS